MNEALPGCEHMGDLKARLVGWASQLAATQGLEVAPSPTNSTTQPPTTQPPTTNHQQPNHQPPTTDHRPPTTDHRPPTTNHQPPTTNHQPPTTNKIMQVTNLTESFADGRVLLAILNYIAPDRCAYQPQGSSYATLMSAVAAAEDILGIAPMVSVTVHGMGVRSSLEFLPLTLNPVGVCLWAACSTIVDVNPPTTTTTPSLTLYLSLRLDLDLLPRLRRHRRRR